MGYKISNVKLTCPKCGKEMMLKEVQWTGEFVFECKECDISAAFHFYEDEFGTKKIYKKQFDDAGA